LTDTYGRAAYRYEKSVNALGKAKLHFLKPTMTQENTGEGSA